MRPHQLTPAAPANVGWSSKRRMFVTAAVLAGSLLGTACSSSSDDNSLAFTEGESTTTTLVETTTTAPVTTTAVTETTSTIDSGRAQVLDEWRRTVSVEVPSILTASNDDAEVLIELMCGLAETSNGESQFLDIPLATLSEELGVTSEAVDLLAAASIELDCPEHLELTQG